MQDSCFWLNQINKQRDSSIGDLANTVRSVLFDCSEDKLPYLNEQLLKIDFKTANSFHLISVLRALRPYRFKIENWEKTLEGTRTMLEAENLDPGKLLKGLEV